MRRVARKIRKKLDYPDETEGSRLAAKARKAASSDTAEQRRAHINAAMALVYGGTRTKEATGTRR